MDPPRARIRDQFPTPVAYSYALIFDPAHDPSVRRWALCFTEYQVLRTLALPLVGQYLRADLAGLDLEGDKAAQAAITKLNTAIAGIRAPFFSDWITLVETLRARLPALGLTPLFPGLGPALDSLKAREPREFPLPGEPELDPLRAILALRNAVAHGGLPDEAAAARHLEAYLPVLHQVLDAFDFLGDCRLLVLDPSGPDPKESGRGLVRMLRGVQPGPAEVLDLDDDLADAFADSPAVLVGPDGRAGPLFPLLNPQPEGRPEDERETIYLYDGHYGARVETKGAAVEKGYIHYLGVHHRVMDTPACARMQELLARRKVEFYLPKEKVAPWTIAETAADYSRNLTLAEMLGRKYLPQCYVPFPELERHFAAFLAAKPPRVGLVLTGPAGSGKSAFLAHQVERLMAPPAGVKDPQDYDVRAHPNLVFFLRGSGILQPEGGVSLERDVAEKLGVSARPGHGIATFGELLQHLNERWKQDRVKDRRLILVLDGLNEAPEPRGGAAAGAGHDPPGGAVPLVQDRGLDPLGVAGRLVGEGHGPGGVGPGADAAQPVRPRGGADPSRPAARPGGVVRAVRPRAGGRGLCPLPGRGPRRGRRPHARLHDPLGRAARGDPGGAAQPPPSAPVHGDVRRPRRRAGGDGAGAVPPLRGRGPARAPRPAQVDRRGDRPPALRSDASLGRPERRRRERDPAARGRPALPSRSGCCGCTRWRTWRTRGGWSSGCARRAAATGSCSRRWPSTWSISTCCGTDPSGEDELSYWTRRAAHERVFPEYAGAFGFLLRDWAAEGKLGLAARMVETAPSWFGDVLKEFLEAQARIEHTPGRASPHAQAAARDLAASGGQVTARRSIRLATRSCRLTWPPRPSSTFRPAWRSTRRCGGQPRERRHRRGLGRALNTWATCCATPAGWRRPSGPTAAPSRSTRRCGRPTPRTSTSATAWAGR